MRRQKCSLLELHLVGDGDIGLWQPLKRPHYLTFSQGLALCDAVCDLHYQQQLEVFCFIILDFWKLIYTTDKS